MGARRKPRHLRLGVEHRADQRGGRMMSESTLDQLLYLLFLVVKILAIVIPLIIAVAYYTYFGR
jgi:hypothetical protein